MQRLKTQTVAPSREELLERAVALVPVLRSRSEAAERMRCCPEETVADFVKDDLIRICQPARYGGFELGWDVRSEVCQVLARGCGAQAWIHHILTDHTQKVAAFDQRAQDDVWRDNPDTRIAAGLAPVGKARQVKGGVIYSGRHGFASGIDHAGWLICGGFIYEDAREPQCCFFLVPRSDVTIIDDWHVMGLAGTGSKSFEVKEAFIPEHRILDAHVAEDGTTPGALANPAPIFRVPFASIGATGFAAISVGIAEGFIAEWTGYSCARSSRGQNVADLMGTQMDLGFATASVDAARRIYLEAAADAMATLTRGEPLSSAQRLRARATSAFAAQLSLKAVERLFNAAGGRAAYTRSTLQRQFRDIAIAAGHISVQWNTAAAAYGAHLLGISAVDPLRAPVTQTPRA